MNYITTILFAGLTLVSLAAGQTIPNYTAANLVLGHTSFTSYTSALTATGLNNPAAVVVDPVTRKVFVSDAGNNRVLRYGNADALANGAPAETVLGQVDFTTSDTYSPLTAKSMHGPAGLFLDHSGRLWVADTGNHRVLMFISPTTIGNTSDADRVYGQPNFTTQDPATTAAGMRSPCGVWVDASDRLWVADTNNNRVLRFDDISNKPNGAAADGVLGHTDFISSTISDRATGRTYAPFSLAVSQSGALFVALENINCVLRFNNAATLGNGPDASAVFGQPDFSSSGFGCSEVRMNEPRGLTVTVDDSLWVCDSGNARVIRFDQASSKPSGSAATGVIGQPNLLTGGYRYRATTAQGLSFPSISPFVDSTGSLWVTDYLDSRVLRYPASPIIIDPPVVDKTSPLLTVSGKVPVSTAKKSITLNGKASDASGIKSVQYSLGTGKLKTATGTTKWQLKVNLMKGKNTLTIIATDMVGNVSGRKVFKITRK